jgi:hypothetical protein
LHHNSYVGLDFGSTNWDIWMMLLQRTNSTTIQIVNTLFQRTAGYPLGQNYGGGGVTTQVAIINAADYD